MPEVALNAARAFRRGAGADLSDDEVDALKSVGVTDASQQVGPALLPPPTLLLLLLALICLPRSACLGLLA
eukprot:67887-Chlamydomonas_euryale.AAC.1